MSNTTPHFKTRARLLCQLGEQLIKNESIALLELVKNAYDADASFCRVKIKNPENEDECSIVIEDDGTGMDITTLQNVWLEIGTDNKEVKKKKGIKSSKYGRISLGEKGIGRLGVHRLGRKIKLISRKEHGKECVLEIDWDEIDNSKYIEDFPIRLTERDAITFKETHGTKIIIKKVRKQWSRGDVRNIARAMNSLSSPFCTNDSFHVDFSVVNNGIKSKWLDGIPSYEEIKDMALYSFSLTIEKDKIIDFSYDFKPYSLLDKVSGRHVSYNDIKNTCYVVDDDGDNVDISSYKIGTIRMEGRIYDLDQKVLNVGLSSGGAALRLYLLQNGGVKVFRDNMRVWDYGEKDNDWLNLDSRRINNPSRSLSNHLLLAAVYLDGNHSSGLVEKANREGFVENETYFAFQKACYFGISMVENLRNFDKEKIRRAYKGSAVIKKNTLDVIDDIRVLINKNIKDEVFLKKLNKRLDDISENYIQTTENLMKSAGAGLNLISVLHQLEKILKSLKYNLQKKADQKIIEEDMDMLTDLVSGYSILTRNSKIKRKDIAELLERAQKNIAFRLRAHGICYEKNPNLDTEMYYGMCSDNLFLNAVMNIFDNSIWWLGYSRTETPKIYVDIKDRDDTYLSILIADNGPGFSINKDELTSPFVTAKPSGLGMGIGLHLTKEILESMGGQILFPEFEDVDIPQEYANGAIVELVVKKA